MTSWLLRIGEPLAASPEEAGAYVSAELEKAVPPGWRVKRVSGPSLAWTISKQVVKSSEWPNQEYAVRIPASLEFVVFTHSNNDVGVLALHHALQNAMYIDASALRHYGMKACLGHVMSRYKPNEWGYT